MFLYIICLIYVLYPKMVQVTYTSHKLYKVAEYKRIQYTKIHKLVANIKKVFRKTIWVL